MKLFEKIKVKDEVEYRFIGISLLHITTEKAKEFQKKDIEIFSQYGIREKIFHKIEKKSKNSYKIFLLNRHGMGETYILANIIKYLHYYQEKEKFCIIARRNYVKDVFELFCPEINVNIIDCKEWHHYFTREHYSYHFKFFDIFLLPSYFEEMNEFFQKDIHCHYYEYLLKHFFLKKQNIHFNSPVLNSNYEQQLLLNFSAKNKLTNLVIICPEALSVAPVDKNFWTILINKLKQKKYNIFVNSKSASLYNPTQDNTLYSVKDLYYIAKNAYAVIGLRAGLLEVLSSLDIPIHVLYAHHPFRKNLDATNYLRTHTIKNIPVANKDAIFEYNLDSAYPEQIITQIMEHF